MLAKRIGELRGVTHELKRCSGALKRLATIKHVAPDRRVVVPMQGPRRGAKDFETRVGGSSMGPEALSTHEQIAVLHSLRYKLLFRKIPIALSRLERCLIVPQKLRSEGHRQGQNHQGALLAGETNNAGVSVVTTPTTGGNPNMVAEVGLQEPRGPQWRRSSFSAMSALQVIRNIAYCDQERRAFFHSEESALLRKIYAAQRNFVGHASTSSSKRNDGLDDAEKNDNSSQRSEEQLHNRLQQLQAALAALKNSIIARPFFSAFLWKAVLQPEFISVLFFPVEIPSFLAPADVHARSIVGAPIKPQLENFGPALEAAAIVSRVVLGILATPQDVNKMSPRFVVSLRTLSDAHEQTTAAQSDSSLSNVPEELPAKNPVRWIPQQASSEIIPLTWLTIHAVGTLLATIMSTHSQSTADALRDAKVESELLDRIGILCDLVQRLQALCSSALLLDPSVAKSQVKQRVLHVAENGLMAAASFVLRHAPRVAQSISQEQACLLLTTLFRLQAVEPDSNVSQAAVSCLVVRLFPILSTATYATLSERLRKQASGSLFANITKKHRAHLRRRHSVTTETSAAAVIANTITEYRVQSRQMAAALKLRQMTELYSRNLAVLEPQPLSVVALLFQIVCMNASGRRVPPPAARLLVGAACLVGEALLVKLTTRPEVKFDGGAHAVSAEFERLTALTMAASSAVPVAREVVGLLPAESRNVSGEYYFVCQLVVHFLRSITALVAEGLQRLGSATSGAPEGPRSPDILRAFSLKQIIYLFDAIGELQSTADLRRGEVSVCNQAKEALQLLKALLGAAGQSWWTEQLSDTSVNSLQSQAHAVHTEYHRILVTTLHAYGITDPVFEASLQRMLRQ